jgi:hypothetical protein
VHLRTGEQCDRARVILHVCSHGLRFVRGYLKARERRLNGYETLAQGQPVVMLKSCCFRCGLVSNHVSNVGSDAGEGAASGQSLMSGYVSECHEKKYYRPPRCA